MKAIEKRFRTLELVTYRLSNSTKVVYFDTKKELDTCITVLDKLLKVTSTNVI